jgi:glutamate 5-kinase
MNQKVQGMMKMETGRLPGRIVVKVGTSTLTHETGKPNLRRLDELASALSDLKNAGSEIILVSSGAIAVGASKLGMKERPAELRLKQAAASVGQCELMHIYDKLFAEYGYTVGQILLTGEDVEHPGRRENLLHTFLALLKLGVVPVVNENDSVSFDEIETGQCKVLGDNDTLSAIVARLISADLLVLLTDIDGLYDADPRENPGARIIPMVDYTAKVIGRIIG